MEKKVKNLGELIKKANNILLINHIRMDMDALGSLSAFYDILYQIGKTVKATNDEIPPNNYEIIGYSNIIETNIDFTLFYPDLIISFDAANKEQLGQVYNNNISIFQNIPFVVIDHHITNNGFGNINIIDAFYSSTCELTYDIINILNLQNYITPQIATALISGIFTDTNIYYNSNTTSNTLKVSSELIKLGADFRKPYFEFYKRKTFIKTKLWGFILNKKLKIKLKGNLAYASISKKTLDKLGANDRDLNGLLSEFFINIEGVKICFLSYELSDGKIKTSLRSQDDYDISTMASFFGGGGHKQAAGFTSENKLKKVKKELINKIIQDFF